MDDLGYIRSCDHNWHVDEGKVSSHYIYLRYELKDGTSLYREYDLWMTADRAGTAGTYENLLTAFYRDPVVRSYDVSIPEAAELDYIAVCSDYTYNYYTNTVDHADGDREETRQIYAALQKDAAEGNVPAKDILQYHVDWYSNNFYLTLYYFSFDTESNGRYHHSKDVYLSPSMTNTIDTLVELEYMTEEDVEQWKQDRAEEERVYAGMYEDTIYPETSTVYVG